MKSNTIRLSSLIAITLALLAGNQSLHAVIGESVKTKWAGIELTATNNTNDYFKIYSKNPISLAGQQFFEMDAEEHEKNARLGKGLGYEIIPNPDAKTKSEYPYAINLIIETRSGQPLTNDVSFLFNNENVKIIFKNKFFTREQEYNFNDLANLNFTIILDGNNLEKSFVQVNFDIERMKEKLEASKLRMQQKGLTLQQERLLGRPEATLTDPNIQQLLELKRK